ncbi:MAG TPA: tripartite tricarboxylate transporter TctB family protein [Spirochaetales bacterium]|nr:tripartite tricarboxylate transporter TctB family protein [Spirochaetales bacterium]
MIKIKTRIFDVGAGIIGLAIAAYIYYASGSFPEPHESQLGAAVFPRLLAILLILFVVFITLDNILKKDKTVFYIKNEMQVLFCFIALLVYGSIFKSIGFLIATPFFIAALLLILRLKNFKTIVVVSLSTTILIYVVFKMLLSVPLPPGIIDSIG